MRDKKLIELLEKIRNHCIDTNMDLELLWPRLIRNNHLSQDEKDIIYSGKNITYAAKILKMFDLLQLKDEKVFQTLHYLFKHLGWKEASDVLVTGLCGTSYGYLIEERTESSTKIQNWEPILFDVRDPTVNFIGRNQQLNELHDIMQRSAKKIGKDAKKIAVIDKTSAVTGLGGIGKTQLALRYVQLYSQHYDNNIVWINAESDATFKTSFTNLAENLKINLKNANGVEKELPVIVREVYTHFSKVKCLFVFDNANEHLKDEFYPNSHHCIYILITSRYQKWGQIVVFHLGNFSPEEASNFIRITLKIQTDICDDQVANLAKTLHFFPLALKQATAYINETTEIKKNTGEAYSIDDYINEYNEQKEKLLNYKFDSEYGNGYFQTTFTTWKITIDKLKGNPSGNNLTQKHIGNIAINVLDCISYFAHEQIDMQIFVQHEHDKEIGVAIQLLKEYSLVTEQNGLLNVHPFVQQLTRLNIKQKKAEKKTFTTVCTLIHPYFEHLIQSNDYSKQKLLLPHLEKLLQEMKNYLIKEKHYGPDNYQIVETLVDLSTTYRLLGQPEKQQTLLEKALVIQEKHYGPDHYEVAQTLINLGTAYGVLRQSEKSKTLLKRALAIQEKHYGVDHYEVAITLIHLGKVYEDLGCPEKQISLLEKALAIQGKYFGPDHYEVVPILKYLGNVYGVLRQPEKSKTLLEKALAIQEKHYGPDHYEVAITLINLNIAYGALGHPEKQKTLLKKALVIQEKRFGQDHYEVAQTLVNLGNAYGNLRQHEKQIMLLEKALVIEEKYYGADHYEVTQTLVDLGIAYGALGHIEKLKILLEKALAIQEKHHGPDHLEAAGVLIILSDAYRVLRQPEKTKTLLKKALSIKKNQFGQDHYEVARVLKKLSDAYGNLGETEKQKSTLEKAREIEEKL